MNPPRASQPPRASGQGHRPAPRRWRLGACLALNLALGLATLLASPWALAVDGGWPTYQSRFITAEGRVVDTGNGNISHSEGQGWGMLLAVAHDDRATFERLWQWTRQHLTRPHDALFAWRYDPRATPPVADSNNASDGDLFIAWALQLAADRWQQRGYASASRTIRDDIASRLIRRQAGMTLLLPGAAGFEQGDALDLNLSYWFMPALVDFAVLEPQGPWQALIDSGQQLLEEARFGRYRLPTDWLRLGPDGEPAPAPDWPPRFGFDAVRIPLYFRWAGLGEAEGLGAIQAFWEDPAHQPPAAWIDVFTEERAPYIASRGVRAIANLAEPYRTRPENAAPLAEEDYYSASLLLLTRLAARRHPTYSP
ncbi:MAG: glycosyl hydrolase family 8 [Pseudomonadota bacterium]